MGRPPPVRRPRRRHRPRHRQMLSAPPRRRVLQVPRRDRSQRARRFRRRPGHGQLRHSQDAAVPQMARLEAALACPAHANLGLVAQPGRALLRLCHRAQDQTGRISKRPGPRGRSRRLHCQQQGRAQTLPLDRIRRRHLRLDRALLPQKKAPGQKRANFWLCRASGQPLRSAPEGHQQCSFQAGSMQASSRHPPSLQPSQSDRQGPSPGPADPADRSSWCG